MATEVHQKEDDISTADTPPARTDAAAITAARFLTPVVRCTQALGLNLKQAHWNIRGANFVAVHELLDTVAANAREAADLAAERVVALGVPVDARLERIAGMGGPTAVSGGFSSWDDTVRAAVADIDDVIVTVGQAVAGLDGTDPSSQDVAIEIMRTLQRDRRLLAAHVALDGR